MNAIYNSSLLWFIISAVTNFHTCTHMSPTLLQELVLVLSAFVLCCSVHPSVRGLASNTRGVDTAAGAIHNSAHPFRHFAWPYREHGKWDLDDVHTDTGPEFWRWLCFCNCYRQYRCSDNTAEAMPSCKWCQCHSLRLCLGSHLHIMMSWQTW